MYEEFFGFKESPFNITPDPKFLFLSPTHQEALAHLVYGIDQKKGFIVLTGEVGCGKTTLCRALLNKLDTTRFDTALILNPLVQEAQLLRDFLKEIGENHLEEPHNLINRVHASLLKKVSQGKNIVMVIDEAQNLSNEVLEQIRLLSNLETDNEKLLQIILMGQPELKDKLAKKELRQLKQRILVHYDLKPLNFQQTRHYIQHRLSVSQGTGTAFFSYWALMAIYRHSSGIPRIINNICDKSLLSAYVNRSNTVSYRDVKKAIKELRIA